MRYESVNKFSHYAKIHYNQSWYLNVNNIAIVLIFIFFSTLLWNNRACYYIVNVGIDSIHQSTLPIRKLLNNISAKLLTNLMINNESDRNWKKTFLVKILVFNFNSWLIIVAENETKVALFNGFYVVADSNEFFLALFRILEQPSFEGGQINFIIQLSFTPNHFFHCTIRAEIAPPTYLLTNDFRETSLAKIISKQRFLYW